MHDFTDNFHETKPYDIIRNLHLSLEIKIDKTRDDIAVTMSN